MYADDGILLTNNFHDSTSLENDEAVNNGIIISDKLKKDGSPSRGIVTEVLKFLGHEFNLNNQTIKINEE